MLYSSHIKFIPENKDDKCFCGESFKHVHDSQEFWHYQLLEANK